MAEQADDAAALLDAVAAVPAVVIGRQYFPKGKSLTGVGQKRLGLEAER